MSTPQIITLGCRLNTFESEIMRQYSTSADLGNAIIINTCAVTAEAERHARKVIRRARRKSPQAMVIVTGCAAQLHPERYSAMPEVDRVIGNLEKVDPATFETWPPNAPIVQVSDVNSTKEGAPRLIEGFEGRTRAFVQIQQGCDYRCTFCIIPYARGPNRSIPINHLIEQVSRLVDKGYKEVVLTGVDICSYGRDLWGESRLGHVVFEILSAVPSLSRIRLSSLDPAALDNKLFGLIADESRLMPHIHLSLQSLDNMVLKRMKRRHTREEGIAAIDRIRSLRPNTTIGADLIAGFPTETEEMFQNTLQAVTKLGLTHLHVFPYSVREGTPAAKMPGNTPGLIKYRAAALRHVGKQAFKKLREKLVGCEVAVLIEKPGEGHSEHYIPTRVAGPTHPGMILNVRVEGITETGLEGSGV